MRGGLITAWVLAVLYLAAVPWSPLNLASAVVFLLAAYRLSRGEAWGGYGGALYLMAGWLSSMIVLVRFQPADQLWATAIMGTLLFGALAFLLFRAGRGLAEAGKKGPGVPWIVLALAAFLMPQLLRPYSIPNGSMENTILIGDQLLVSTIGGSPLSRGDLMVFRYPPDVRQTFVKRCVGVPGDRIRIVDKQLYLNGKRVDEPYACHKTSYVDPYRDNFPSEPASPLYGEGQDMLSHHVVNGEVVVPPGSYFAMGDNRDSSLDSRYWGFVPRANLIGKPWVIYWSTELERPLGGYNGVVEQIANRYRGFFTKARWGRVLMPIRGSALN